MSFDKILLAEKLKRYRDQLEVTVPELSEKTGIPVETISAYEAGEKLPTGDEILILADFYKCDYKFFISNEPLSAIEQTETLFRKHGDAFSKIDRWAVQEVLFLLENYHYLAEVLGKNQYESFTFQKKGNFFKGHGIEAAKSLRKHFEFSDNEVRLNIYQKFSQIGVRVFRRKLENSNISGMYLKHPYAGKCLLINYNEDIYRQRFTATHEMAHAILDAEEDVVVSFHKWEKNDLVEIRANTFASHFLMPPEFLNQIPEPRKWTTEKGKDWASRLKVSTEALSYALKEAKLIDYQTQKLLKSVRVPMAEKIDPELSESLSPKQRERKKTLLQMGLTTEYVNDCFNAYRENIISFARAAEMLLASEDELNEIFDLFGEVRRHEA